MAAGPLAVIDIGSNSARLIVVRMAASGHLEVLADARARLKLVREITRYGRLGEDGLRRTVAAVTGFLAVAGNEGASQVLAVATAAVREAADRAAFVTGLREATGVAVTVLDGDGEARLACLGAVHGLPVESGTLLDIGGGSLEIAGFRRRRQVAAWTLPLGALRLSDMFLAGDPPRPVEMEALSAHVRSLLTTAGVPPLAPGHLVVGTGGTLRSVAKIHRAARPAAPARLHGYTLRRGEVVEIARRLAARPLSRRTSVAGLNGDRADSIIGGCVTLLAVLDHLGADEMMVSGQGLREGLALQHAGAGLPPPADVRRQSVAAVASRFSTWTEDRAEARRALAVALVDALDPAMPEDVREGLLHAATILDAGRSIDFYGRWHHAAAIVSASDLTGFSPRGIALIACIIETAAAGRVRIPPREGPLTRDDRQPIERAGVVLVLADQLEKRMVPGATVAVRRRDRPGAVVVSAPTNLPWQAAGDIAKRFRHAFGRPLAVDSGSDGGTARGVVLELK